MKFSPIALLLFVVPVFLVGCGKNEEAAAPQAQSKDKEAKKAEKATPKEVATPWETPNRLALFMTQKIEDANRKASALITFASALAEAGDKEQALAILMQAMDVAQRIEDARSGGSAPLDIEIASALSGAPNCKRSSRYSDNISCSWSGFCRRLPVGTMCR